MRRRFTLNKGFTKTFDFNNYLTIEALEDDFTLTFTNDIEYGIDGKGWIKLKAGYKTQSINTGQTLSFRGNLTPNSSNGIGSFIVSKKCNLLGNCMSMLFGDNAANNYSLSGKDYVFCGLFTNCSNIITVSENFLPATTLADYCYSYMFENCTSLTTAPELPATTLAIRCYGNMFYDCTSLTTAPELPATTLADYCYSYMFENCKSLTTAPTLPATTLADNCYRWMFYNCTKLNYIKILATDISASNCLHYWVYNVASTGTFVKSPDMNSLPTGHSGIPNGWTVVNDGEESGGNLITFTIDGIEYQAEEGMTWGEWVNSEYNVINAYIYEGYIHIRTDVEGPRKLIYYSGYSGIVRTTQEIITNHNYIIASGGADN